MKGISVTISGLLASIGQDSSHWHAASQAGIKLSMKAPAIDQLVHDELMALRSRPRARELADREACSAQDAGPVRTPLKLGIEASGRTV